MAPEDKPQPDKSPLESIRDLQREFEDMVQSHPLDEDMGTVAQALIEKGYAIEQVYEFLGIKYR